MRWVPTMTCAFVLAGGCTALNPLYGADGAEAGADGGKTGSGSGVDAGEGTGASASGSSGDASAGTAGTDPSEGLTSTSGPSGSTSASSSHSTSDADTGGGTSGNPMIGPAPTCPDQTPAQPESIEPWIDAFLVRGDDPYAGDMGDDLNYGATPMHSLYDGLDTAVYAVSFGQPQPNEVVAAELYLPLHGGAIGGLEVRAGPVGFGEGEGDAQQVQAGESSWLHRFSPDEAWFEGPPNNYPYFLALENLADLSISPGGGNLVGIELDNANTLGHYQGGGGSLLVIAAGVTEQQQLFLDSRESSVTPMLVFWVCD